MNLLDNVDLTLHLKILIAYLNISNPWKGKREVKESKTNLLNKVEKVLLDEVGVERTENILRGLR